MDDETRELVVEMLTRIGMMLEDLSLIAVRAANVSGEDLSGLVAKIQREVEVIKVLGEEAGEACRFDHRTH